MRRLLPLLVLFVSPLFALGLENPLDTIRRLPDTNPYRAILEHHSALSATDRTALAAWASAANGAAKLSDLSAPQRQSLQSLAAAVIASARRPPLFAEDWIPRPVPQSYTDRLGDHIPVAGPLRNLSQLCIKLADRLPPHEALPIYASVAQLARNHRFGATLIHQLTGCAIEGLAMGAAMSRLHECSLEETRRLDALLKALHPQPTLEAVFAGERGHSFVPLLEDSLKPALQALLAADINLDTKEIVERPLRSELSQEHVQTLETFLEGPRDEIETRWAQRIKAHPRGVDGCLEDVTASYDRIIARHLRAAGNPAAPSDAPAAKEDLYLAALMPRASVARTLQRANTEAIMIRAALQYRLARLGDPLAAAPKDPWAKDGAGFIREDSPDGGFLLRSRYEVSPGEPLTYKFAAPDAGFIRVTKP